MRISDWSSDVCSSDLLAFGQQQVEGEIIAVAHRSHDRPTSMIAPIGGGDGLVRMIVGDRLPDERAGRCFVEYRILVAENLDNSLIFQAMRVKIGRAHV